MARSIKSFEQIHNERGFNSTEPDSLKVATVAGVLMAEIELIDFLLNLEDVSDEFKLTEIRKVVNKYITEK